MTHQLGDEPIEPRYASEMRAIAEALDIALNGGATGIHRRTGFVLMVFPFGSSDGRCNYISNGADRKDIVKLLREQANRFEADDGRR